MLTEGLIAIIHLDQHPGQRAHDLIHVGDDLAEQVRNAVVAGQFHHLGIDHDELEALRPMLHEQPIDDGVDADRLAGSGLSGDEHMRGADQIHDDRLARGVASQRQDQVAAHLAHLRAFENVAQAHHLSCRYWALQCPT